MNTPPETLLFTTDPTGQALPAPSCSALRTFLICFMLYAPGYFALEYLGVNFMTVLVAFWGGMIYKHFLSQQNAKA